MIVYFNGSFMAKEEVRISPDDRGFLFADGIYEVIRSYHGTLFKVEEHLRRLKYGLKKIEIACLDVDGLGEIAGQLLKRNGLTGDATIYVQITRGASSPRKHTFPDSVAPTVYASASPLAPPVEKIANGVTATLVPDIRWAHCDIKSVALLPNVMANQQAKERGVEEAVFVRDGVLTEGSHTNVCAVLDGEFVTHPKSNLILGGITRGVVLDLCRDLGIPVREFPLFVNELPQMDEFMILSTIYEVTPVIEVDGKKVGTGKPGSIARKLQKAFKEFVTGTSPR